MKSIKNIMVACVLAAGALVAQATDCTIDLSIAPISKGKNVPEQVESRLEAKLQTMLAKSGFFGAPYDSRFFIAARFDDLSNDITGGPSQKVIVKTTLTLFIGDAQEEKVFDSESFDLKGVGGSDTQAYVRAIEGVSARNPRVMAFLEGARTKIIDYFDRNYTEYINKARRAMLARNYDEALYYSTVIPSCCKGYEEAAQLSMQIMTQRADYEGAKLLAKARGAWAADPTASGAAEAYSYLSQIDPDSKCYAEAQALGRTMSKATQKQWEFENVTKYKDAVAIERQRIEAAREVGVAWANNQPKEIHRYHFINARYW